MHFPTYILLVVCIYSHILRCGIPLWDSVKCHILLVTCAFMICQICMPAALKPSDPQGLGIHIKQIPCAHVTTIICVCIYACLFVCVYIYICTYVRMYVCTYVRMYVCMYVCMYVGR